MLKKNIFKNVNSEEIMSILHTSTTCGTVYITQKMFVNYNF